MYNGKFDLEGVYNFRDLGGYPGDGGRKVKKGVFYRSDDLSKATGNDLSVISSLPVITNIDFRYMEEIKLAPNRIPSSLKNNVELSIEVGNLIESRLKDTGSVKRMEEIYRLLVREFQYIYAEFFKILTFEENIPVLFHCSAGKDRTGFAAAMILSALNVDRDIIIKDYMLSKKFIEPKYRELIAGNEELYPYYTVEKSYLEAAFDVIDTEYNGTEDYLRNCLKLDTAGFRAKFLE